jgi:hypothetical protein
MQALVRGNRSGTLKALVLKRVSTELGTVDRLLLDATCWTEDRLRTAVQRFFALFKNFVL